MKTLAIMQPYFMPYIGYFQLIKAADVFVIYDDVNYIKRGWINKNNILGTSGPQPFTLPVHKASQNKLINEIELFEMDKFRNKFFKTLEQVYRKSPQYPHALELLNSIFSFTQVNLSDFLKNSLKTTCDYLEINTPIVPSSATYNNNNLKAQDRILDICVQEKAQCYINPIGGVELYSQEKFESKGVELNFLKSHEIKYSQGNSDFVPYLSIIDVLMFNSKDEIKELLNKYTLIKN
ncbi:MAG: WbqC family protein [Bacteroidetes bacterium]|nr:WbqC family protein [Bacteroidota bacterium]